MSKKSYYGYCFTEHSRKIYIDFYSNRSFVDGKLTSKDIISSRILKSITNQDTTAVKTSAKPNPLSDSNKGNVDLIRII